MPIFTIKTPSGHELDIDAADEATAMNGAQEWYAQNVTNKTDTSVTGALSQGASDLVSGVGKTIKEYASPSAGKSVQDAGAAITSPKYKSATEGFMRPEDGADKHTLGLDWSKLPRAMVEQAPGLAADLGSSYVSKKLLSKYLGPLAPAVGGVASYMLRSTGNEAQKRADARTGEQGSEPSTEDKTVGLGSAAAQAALNQFGANRIISPARVTGTGAKGVLQAAGNVAKGSLAEGATNAAQDLVSQAAATAGTDTPIDMHSPVGSAVLGAAGGGLFSTAKGVKDANTAVRLRGTDYGADSTLAANRLLDKVSKPGDLEDASKAYDAHSAATADVKGELTSAAKNVTNPSTEAANAISRAKSGEAITQKDLAAVDAEGDTTVSSLVRQAAALNKLSKIGNYDAGEGRFAGGAAEFARKNAKSALYSIAGLGALPHIIGHGGVGLDTLSSALPGVMEGIAAGYGGYKALKIADKGVGVSSPARSFAEKFGDGSGTVRPDVQINQSPTGPKVVPQNSLTTPQPWGPVADKPTAFKPDMLDSNIAKIVEKLQNQKRRDTANQAMPLLRQLAQQNQPAPAAPGPDVSAMNEQVKSALLMASARRKIEGQRQAEAEAADSHMVNEQGGLDAIRNPAMGKRAQELISAATALARLRRVPEAEDAPPTAPNGPEAPQASPSPQAPPAAEPQPFVLPESPHVFKTPKEAADAIYAEAVAGGKEIRHPEGFKAGTVRRLQGEEDIYNTISKSLSSVQERGAFHDYLSALWGSDSPEVVQQVREHMLAAFPQHAETINKHLSDAAIKGLWTKPKKKK
jgi:hypothetical protein